MSWKSTEALFGKYKKYWRKNQDQGGHTLSTRVGARPLSCGPPEAPSTSTPTPYISSRGEKNQRESFIAFYDTEPPPSPNLSREGWSRVRSGLWRGGFIAVVIINHPPSPISWCSVSCVSNSIVGLLDDDGLDEIYHVIKLVSLGFDPQYPLCHEIDVVMTLLCLMLVTRARVPWFQIWTYYVFMNICVFLILSCKSIVTYYVLWSDNPEVTIIGILLGDDRSLRSSCIHYVLMLCSGSLLKWGLNIP